MAKRTLVALAAVLALCSVSQADMQGGTSGQGGEKGAADALKCPPVGPLGITLPQTEGMEACQAVTPQSAAPLMVREILETMTEMLKIQEKIVRGAGAPEKKVLLKDIARLREKVERLLAAQAEMTSPRYPSTPADKKESGTR